MKEEAFDLESTVPAGFWIRVLAYMIDGLIMLLLVVPALFIKSTTAYMAVLVPMILYKPLLEGLLGGTAGKLAIGLRVISPEGGRIGVVGGFVRSAIFLLPTLPGAMMKIRMIDQGISSFDPEAVQAFQASNELLYYSNIGLSVLVIISCLVIAFTAGKRGLHDMVADTYVIRIGKGES